MENFYLIDKPLNISSFDIIRKLRKKFNMKKMWHTWTLDPLATWWMLIATGNYTKLIPYLEKESKEYEFVINLDWTTSSLDLAEEIEFLSKDEQKKAKEEITLEKIEELIKSDFFWEIIQVPPKYSAIKINWKRAYELARQWKEVEMKSRKITILEHSIISYKYPQLKLRAKVSAWTYIRTIAWDLWAKLWTGWYISYLRRTKIWNLDISDSIELENIEPEKNISVKKVLNLDNFLIIDPDKWTYNNWEINKNDIIRLQNWLERLRKFNLEINKNYFLFDWDKITNVIMFDWEKLIPVKKII
jgi:tRNA pseudouridine55 synthase